MSQFHTDQPITGSAESPDTLGREKFAELVGASLLLKADSPGIVVSLEGPWGYGKTSAINLIQKYFESLAPKNRPLVIGFNPWMVSGTDNLTQEFLVQLASQIGKPDRPEEAKNAARQILSYSKIFTAMKYIPGAEPWATIVKDVIESVGDASASLGKLKELSIEDRRDKVVEAIRGLGQPVVVFLDDIDRLPPDEVFQMIRMVKAVADFPRVAFVLALDPDYVNKALDTSKVANPAQYLDKIIQVRLPLPIIEQKAIEVMVNEELAKLVPEATRDYFTENKNRLAELYQTSVKYLLQSPRDVRKLFNNVAMREPHVRGEVGFADLLGLEVLAIKAPGIYRHICENYTAYTGVDTDDWGIESASEKLAKYKEERDKAFGEVVGINKRHIKKLLELLFPQLDEDGEDVDQSVYSQNGRVAALDRLMIALKFGLPMSEVSTNTVRTFISNQNAREGILIEIGKPETIGRFVELLALAIEQLDVAEPEHFIDVIVRLAELPLTAEMERSRRDVLASGLYRQLWRVLRVYFGKLDHDRRLVHLKTLVRERGKVGLGAFALDHCLRQSGFYNSGDSVREDLRWCTKEELDEIMHIWVATVKEHGSRDGVFSLNGAGEIFFLLRRIDNIASAEIVLAMLEEDADVDTLVKTIAESGIDSAKGRYAHVTDDFLDSIGGKEKIRARVQKRLESNVEASIELRAMYRSIVSGKKVYLVDDSEGEPF